MSTEEFLKYLEGYLEPLKEKIDCLEETIKLIKEKMIKPNSDSIEKLEENVNRISDEIPPLLKRLSGATNVRSAAHTESLEPHREYDVADGLQDNDTDSKPSYGCFLFTYCSECIVAFDDCKRKGIQQVVVEQEDIEKINELNYLSFKEKYLGGKE